MVNNFLFFIVALTCIVATDVFIVYGDRSLVELLFASHASLRVQAICSFISIGWAGLGLLSMRFRKYGFFAICGFAMYWLAVAMVYSARQKGEFGYGAMVIAVFFIGVPGFVMMILSSVFIMSLALGAFLRKISGADKIRDAIK